MKVELVAHTWIHENLALHMDLQPNMFDSVADILAEFAGRACYQSFDRPNEKTRANPNYLANILEQGHESVLEHASATFYVTGVSRSLTHELIRHRHLSFSELSQRFVDLKDSNFVAPPAQVQGKAGANTAHVELQMESAIDKAVEAYSEIVSRFEEAGLPRKQAREAARAVMPNATETRIVVTGNMRAWRDVLKRRWHVAADAEIRQFAGLVLAELKRLAPGQFQDFPAKPFGSDA